MTRLGFDIGHSETPITPIMVGNEALTMAFSKGLLAEGVFVSGIVFPTVPLGKGRLRVMLSAGHTKDDLDFAISAFEKVGKALKIIG
jgi:glycine C-acetyltransferase